MTTPAQLLASRPEFVQMELLVELTNSSGEPFTCTLRDWNFIRELGRTFGWHPVGTTYLPQQGQRARHNPIKHDYQPGGSRDSKQVGADDAARWAGALDAAQRSPFISGMLRTHASLQDQKHSGAERSLQFQLQSFIRFARRGAFTIALKDASPPGDGPE